MQINLSQQQRELAPEDVLCAYKRIQFKHTHYEQLQHSHDMYYLKFAGTFALLSLWFLHMQHKGIISDFRTGVAIAGAGFLISFIMLTVMGFENDRNLSYCAIKGRKLEEEYPSIILSRDFTVFESHKIKWYRTRALFRLFPTIFVFTCTAIAGVSLSIMVSHWLTFIAPFFSVVSLLMGLFVYFRAARKTQRHDV